MTLSEKLGAGVAHDRLRVGRFVVTGLVDDNVMGWLVDQLSAFHRHFEPGVPDALALDVELAGHDTMANCPVMRTEHIRHGEDDTVPVALTVRRLGADERQLHAGPCHSGSS
jgi:hypothetical protein